MQQSLRWPPLIDPCHDLFGPLDGVRDRADCRRNSRPCLILRQLPGREDRLDTRLGGDLRDLMLREKKARAIG
jgi:hypothetical protein